MSRHSKVGTPIALAERTLVEALRLFVRLPQGTTPPLAANPVAVPALGEDELIALVDGRTLTAEPASKAMLVYTPAPMLLDTLRFDVSNEEWTPFDRSRADAARPVMQVGAMRGGVLVALAAADQPQGRLSRLRVLVSPTFRHLGLGHLVLHRAVRALLHDGLLPYVRLATSDLGARSLARTVGFVNITRSLGVSALPVYGI
jgi:GNAT superfamily N-acetyltransferase